MFGFGSSPPAPPAPTTPNYSAPSNDPQNGQINQGSQQLETQTSMDELATIQTNIQTEALTTANSIRQTISSTMEGIMNQALSLASQFVGDEIAQAKKGLENAGKAV